MFCPPTCVGKVSFFLTLPRVLPWGVFHSTVSPCLNSSWATVLAPFTMVPAEEDATWVEPTPMRSGEVRRIYLPRTLVHKDESGIKGSSHPKDTVELSKRNKPLTQSLPLFNSKLRAAL